MNSLEVLTQQYTEPHRHYHNLSHIGHMFAVANSMGIQLNRVQRLAIWWHDAVCDPRVTANEMQSIDMFARHTEDLTGGEIDGVIEIMRDTITHVPSTPDSAIVQDLDMFILAESESRYITYFENLWKEYEAVGVTRKEYLRGRTKWLTATAAKSKIFHTDMMFRFEQCAVRNMVLESCVLMREKSNKKG